MSFRLESALVDFDGSNPGAPGTHQYFVSAPSGERILYGWVATHNPSTPEGLTSQPRLYPRSITIDGTSQITGMSFVLPDTAGERSVHVMYYTV